MNTVLLVDDEANLRILVRTTLEDSSCRVLEAHEGKMALALARRESPDLILLDWMMPGMNGIEFVGHLKGHESTARIPVIMLTARGQEKDRLEALSAGCEHFLVKPFSPLELLELVRAALERVGLERADENAARAGITRETLEQLEQMDPQLALFVRDLRRSVAAERARARELAEANQRLEALNRLKTDFLSFVSHELRTPLNAISAVEMLETQQLDSDHGELVGIVRHGYDRLRSFIEKGLEYFDWLAREGPEGEGRSDLAKITTDVLAAAHCVSASNAVVRTHGLQTPCFVRGDAPALANVVRIMVENAVKFSSGDRTIRIVLDTHGERATLSVSDQGVGLRPELLQEIFQPFTCADVSHHTGGTGLNLALARVIVEATGGAIRAESEGPGRGATFVVELPLAHSGDAPLVLSSEHRLARR